MPVSTALNRNVDKVEAVARDVERLEQRAAMLRAAMLDLLIETSKAAESAGKDAIR